MTKANEYVEAKVSAIHKVLVWLDKDNGHQNRLSRLVEELKGGHDFTEEEGEILGSFFKIAAEEYTHLDGLLEGLRAAGAGLQGDIERTEEKLAQLKGESNKQDQEWIARNF